MAKKNDGETLRIYAGDSEEPTHVLEGVTVEYDEDASTVTAKKGDQVVSSLAVTWHRDNYYRGNRPFSAASVRWELGEASE